MIRGTLRLQIPVKVHISVAILKMLCILLEALKHHILYVILIRMKCTIHSYQFGCSKKELLHIGTLLSEQPLESHVEW